ncbi:hypothetical protein BLNAU_15906 [Blattamonas nauphoetae]|uniref:Uncharacterized protein n=1 Tax=Blattamonas nauphoetae TaxID=2049346 RepID=A0ABQ9XG96_9EUKA|nr:hypothetical protein BLNAU_15906 [Blattamonas nauphoetae]
MGEVERNESTLLAKSARDERLHISITADNVVLQPTSEHVQLFMHHDNCFPHTSFRLILSLLSPRSAPQNMNKRQLCFQEKGSRVDGLETTCLMASGIVLHLKTMCLQSTETKNTDSVQKKKMPRTNFVLRLSLAVPAASLNHAFESSLPHFIILRKTAWTLGAVLSSDALSTLSTQPNLVSHACSLSALFEQIVLNDDL